MENQAKILFQRYKRAYLDLKKKVVYNSEVWTSAMYYDLYPWQSELTEIKKGRVFSSKPRVLRNKVCNFLNDGRLTAIECYDGFIDVCLEYFAVCECNKTVFLGFYYQKLDRVYVTEYDDNGQPKSTHYFQISGSGKGKEERYMSLSYHYYGNITERIDENSVQIFDGKYYPHDVTYMFVYDERGDLLEIVYEFHNPKLGETVKGTIKIDSRR